MILRINDALRRRKYIVWVDTEQMKGSVMCVVIQSCETT